MPPHPHPRLTDPPSLHADLPLSFESVQPLHRRWQQYMHTLLAGAQPYTAQRAAAAAAGGGSARCRRSGAPPTAAACLEDRLAGADLHGCMIRVAESSDRRYPPGLSGIVVSETQQVGRSSGPASGTRCPLAWPPPLLLRQLLLPARPVAAAALLS